MDAKTLKALLGSIAKWERIVRGIGVDRGPDNCPLCALFNTESPPRNSSCKGCPVKEASRVSFCLGTPYVDFHPLPEAKRRGGFDWSKDPRSLKTAQAELDFLRSLLPEGEVA